MPGIRITEHQANLYLSKRKHYSRAISAAKAGISVSSAKRIDKGEWSPFTKRHWRTRKDPLEKVWESIIVPLLQQDLDNELRTSELFEYLCEFHGESFKPSSRNTLYLRVAQWRQLHGGSKDVKKINSGISGGVCGGGVVCHLDDYILDELEEKLKGDTIDDDSRWGRLY